MEDKKHVCKRDKFLTCDDCTVLLGPVTFYSPHAKCTRHWHRNVPISVLWGCMVPNHMPWPEGVIRSWTTKWRRWFCSAERRGLLWDKSKVIQNGYLIAKA